MYLLYFKNKENRQCYNHNKKKESQLFPMPILFLKFFGSLLLFSFFFLQSCAPAGRFDIYEIGKINGRKDFPSGMNYNNVSVNMQQVWKNIILNAHQVMYDTKKVLSIKIENIPDYLKDYRSLSIVEEPLYQREDVNNWIEMMYIDSGIGIPELQEKLFTPFLRSGGGSTELVVGVS